ncbi:MAG TPA: GTP-binding protein [Methylovirgula sp.]|nr:GTP-binding protein [Methylovirgula sp.]
MQPRIFPLTVITGFLGAGKTSLLNRLLRTPELAHSLVLINEFGEIGLDHLLVEKVTADRILLTSGCLCCTIRGDLISALEGALRDHDNGRVDFDRVVVETTGLADPAPVLHTIMYHPYIMLRFRLDGVVTLVDAVTGDRTLDQHSEAVKQAAVADRLVISKTDLLPAEDPRLAALQARLARLNPTAMQLVAANASARDLFNIGLYDPDRKSPDVRRWLNAEAIADRHEAHGHDSDGAAHHGHRNHHDINRHDARIQAFALRHAEPLAPAALELFLELLRNAHGAHLLRLKGIVALSDDPTRPLVVHGVQHVFHPPARLEAWPDEDRATRLVFILHDIEPSFVEELFGACVNAAAPDRPDRAALMQNPLSPARGGLLR